jgi:hypothetical protein
MPLPDEYDVSAVPLEVLDLYERLTFKVIATGRIRYSSDAILHRIRWHFEIDKGNREFKCNDHWTAHLSRWFIARHPEHAGFFELRASPGEYALL